MRLLRSKTRLIQAIIIIIKKWSEKPVYMIHNEGELSNETNKVMKNRNYPRSNHIHGDDCIKEEHMIVAVQEHHGTSKTIASSTDLNTIVVRRYYVLLCFCLQCNNCGLISVTLRQDVVVTGTYLSSSGDCSCTVIIHILVERLGRYYDDMKEVGCNSIVVSLAPTHPIQTVYIKEPLITTARATYMDGSIKTVVCTTEFSTSVLKKDQAVILKYSYSINGVSYSKDCEIRVTTLPRHKTC